MFYITHVLHIILYYPSISNILIFFIKMAKIIKIMNHLKIKMYFKNYDDAKNYRDGLSFLTGIQFSVIAIKPLFR